MNQARCRTLSFLTKGHNTVRSFSVKQRNRSARMQQKQEDLISMIESHQETRDKKFPSDSDGASTILFTSESNSKKNHDEIQQRLGEERATLFKEAGVLTRSLYKSCLRCVEFIRDGNQHDFEDFEAREEQQKTGRFTRDLSASFSFEPPVERENELSSRAMYYLAYTKESFNQEVDCLFADPWREDSLKRFIYLIRQGEEKRKWILEDYRFMDPCPEMWDEERIQEWEKKAWKLIRETYALNGWLYQDDFTNDDEDYQDEGIDWNEDDDSGKL
eukprot:scaffold10555_cov228-Chaetoceros_neogracile.AAC.6